jgi:hypothetical protein
MLPCGGPSWSLHSSKAGGRSAPGMVTGLGADGAQEMGAVSVCAACCVVYNRRNRGR